MIDSNRILAKLDELESYLEELRQIRPASFEEYQKIEKRRACERLLQISVESVIDVCTLLVSGLRLGLPSEENDIFEKLTRANVISPVMQETLKKMKGFRNLLVHEYGRVNDQMVFEFLRLELGDFEKFKEEILQFLKKN
ncbi:DUF86 domain-containing protein [Candidatus Acetothermia bacterium]|nr:DUF86 domain-containing protein [Candidatus Acetothermia bacterium]MBI3461401.1 DUF86 domain-containing protein [Candidatus Acetothermia bacterium]MBI3659768.1 DUF86 domain-containing protein [Candidatus Acetothermia bacterium]